MSDQLSDNDALIQEIASLGGSRAISRLDGWQRYVPRVIHSRLGGDRAASAGQAGSAALVWGNDRDRKRGFSGICCR